MRSSILIAFLALTLTTPALALQNPFGPSLAEEKAALAKYCGAENPTEEQAMGVDLAALDTARDAKALASYFGRATATSEDALRKQDALIKKTGLELERHFRSLYAKEVHDGVWSETRPIKQAAFRKVHGEILAMQGEFGALRAKALRLADITDVLNRISRDFKEVKP